MLRNKIYILLITFPLIVFSQVNTTSPYSFYGIGNIQNTGLSQNIFMGGIANAFHDSENLNFYNPSSYSFLNLTSVELAFQLSTYNMQQGNLSKTDFLSNIIGIGLGFPLSKNASIALGFRPYSAIGYEIGYTDTQDLNELSLGDLSYSFSGNGGLNKVIFGGSYKFEFNRDLIISTGFNLNYFFGTISRTNSIEVDTTGFYNYRETSSVMVRDFQFDYGLMIDQKIKDKNVCFGIMYSPSTQLKSTDNIFAYTYTLSGQYEYFGDTIQNSNEQQGFMDFPSSLSLGVSLYKTNNWLFSFDYNYTNWEQYKLFNVGTDYIENINEFIIGGYFTPKLDDIHNYWNRIQYRWGISYSSGYLNLNSFESSQNNIGLLKDYKISLGLGMPIPKNKSEFNFGMQFGYRGSSESILISEKYLNLIFSMTFNDKWFKKRKIQ